MAIVYVISVVFSFLFGIFSYWAVMWYLDLRNFLELIPCWPKTNENSPFVSQSPLDLKLNSSERKYKTSTPHFLNVAVNRVFSIMRTSPVFLDRLRKSVLYNLHKSSKMMKKVKVKDLWIEGEGPVIDTVRLLTPEEIQSKSYVCEKRLVNTESNTLKMDNFLQEDENTSFLNLETDSNLRENFTQKIDKSFQEKVKNAMTESIKASIAESFNNGEVHESKTNETIFYDCQEKFKVFRDLAPLEQTKLNDSPIFLLIHLTCPAMIKMVLSFNTIVNVELKMAIGNFRGPMILQIPIGYKMGVSFLDSMAYDLKVETTVKKRKNSKSNETLSSDFIKQQFSEHGIPEDGHKKGGSLNNLMKRIIKYNGRRKSFYPNIQPRPIAQLLPRNRHIEFVVPNFAVGYSFLTDLSKKLNISHQKIDNLSTFSDEKSEEMNEKEQNLNFLSNAIALVRSSIEKTAYKDGSIWTGLILHQINIFHSIEMLPHNSTTQKSRIKTKDGLSLHKFEIKTQEIVEELKKCIEMFGNHSLNAKYKKMSHNNASKSTKNKVKPAKSENDDQSTSQLKFDNENENFTAQKEKISGSEELSASETTDEIEKKKATRTNRLAEGERTRICSHTQSKSSESFTIFTNYDTETVIESEIASISSEKASKTHSSQFQENSSSEKFFMSYETYKSLLDSFMIDKLFYFLFPRAKSLAEYKISDEITRYSISNDELTHEWIKHCTQSRNNQMSYVFNTKTQEFISIELDMSKSTDSFYDSTVLVRYFVYKPVSEKEHSKIKGVLIEFCRYGVENTPEMFFVEPDLLPLLNQMLNHKEQPLNFISDQIPSDIAKHIKIDHFLIKSFSYTAQVLDSINLSQFLTQITIYDRGKTFNAYKFQCDDFLLCFAQKNQGNKSSLDLILIKFEDAVHRLIYTQTIQQNVNDTLLPLINFREILWISANSNPHYFYLNNIAFLEIFTEKTAREMSNEYLKDEITIQNKTLKSFRWNLKSVLRLKITISSEIRTQLRINLQYPMNGKTTQNFFTISTEQPCDLMIQTQGKVILTIDPQLEHKYTVKYRFVADEKSRKKKKSAEKLRKDFELLANDLLKEDLGSNPSAENDITFKDDQSNIISNFLSGLTAKRENADKNRNSFDKKAIYECEMPENSNIPLELSSKNLFLIDAVFVLDLNKPAKFQFSCNSSDKIFWDFHSVYNTKFTVLKLSHSHVSVNVNCYGLAQCEKDLYKLTMKSTIKQKVKCFTGHIS